MATIVTRAGKGSPLTNTEVDANFTNLNTDKAELSGATFTGEIQANGGIALGDNDKATFGASDDLQIYHDGANSFINDTGTGNLYIQASDNIYFQSADGSHRYAQFINGGASLLKFDNTTRISTTSTGIDVNGTAVMDGLTVNSGATSTTVNFGNSGTPYATWYNDINGVSIISADAGNTGGATRLQFNAGGVQALRIQEGGDIRFYEDTGTTAKLTWDASAESLNFADNGKATFGASADLQIYHDGSNSYIKDAGIGDLVLNVNNFRVKNAADSEIYLFVQDGGGVNLYHTGNSIKLSTTSTGIDVTGTVVADALSVGGTLNLTGLFALTGTRGTFVDSSENSTIPHIFATNDDVGDFSQEAGHLVIQPRVHTSVFRDIIFAGGTTNAKRLMTIQGEGDISFYEDTGTTAKFHWDASAEKLNLSGTGGLDVSGTVTADGTTSNSAPKYNFSGDTDTGLGYIGTNTVGLIAGGSRKFYVNATHAFFQNLTGGVDVPSLNIASTTVIDASRNLTNIGTISSGVITATGGNSGQWNTAYGWGDHASAGYTTAAGTTYTAGTGITLTGQAFSLTDTNSKLNLSGGTMSGTLTVTGEITANGGIALGDNDKATFGASDDLQIYHNGNQSFIADTGTGDLFIRASNTFIQSAGNENGLSVVGDGAVQAYFNNALKLSTTATGIDVTGTATMDGLTVSGSQNSKVAYFDDSSEGGSRQLQFTSSNNGQYWDINSQGTSGGLGGVISLSTRSIERFRIATDGSLSTPTLGASNVRFGVNAGNSIVSGGNYNTVVGDEAGTAITTGDVNTFVGYSAGAATTTGGSNSGFGRLALANNTTGSNNLAVGVNALYLLTTGTYNTAVGNSAGAAITTGQYNTAVGGLALDANTTASNNTAVGYASLGTNTTGTQNVALGSYALDANTTASNNTAVGHSSLTANTTGTKNVCIGYGAGDAITTGSNNTIIGDYAGTAGLADTIVLAAGTTERMRIDSSGNVGIGVSSPNTKLHLDEVPATIVGGNAINGSTMKGIKIETTANGNESVGLWFGTNGVHWSGMSGQRHNADTGWGTDLRFYTHEPAITDLTYARERMRIDASGNVGIGTTAPAAKLQVEELGIDTTTTSTTAVTQVAIDSMVAATFRSARYTIQVTNSTDGTYHLTEMLLIHDGTTPSINEFGTIYTGSAAEAVFTADINSGNVRILATPASTDAMAFKVIRHSITV